ncbi:peroxidase-related enzyme [Caballeronia sp. LZ034LL]|uniref:peroxidase-related enzyme n=1 Tax=Caballeronia sp. LZ034LL TaxID=3038567 RepID=UPI00285FCF6E|nr:peroxidase-related enzyme [Caballeronia sp. LZ034LL]MDR5836084.1 peroxidase-related enzyme [Caballeronia sp. LZ034LL]
MAEVLTEHVREEPHVLSRLAVPAPDTLDEEIRALVERHGGDNWIRALALNPATARRFAQYFEGLFDPAGGRLPIEERELIAVIVSRTNGCGLCAIHHAHALGTALGDRARARRIALDHHLADLSPRQLALAEIAERITTSPREVRPADFDRLRALGLSDADILEAVETASWFNHTNRIFIATGVVPDEKYFTALA